MCVDVDVDVDVDVQTKKRNKMLKFGSTYRIFDKYMILLFKKNHLDQLGDYCKYKERNSVA